MLFVQMNLEAKMQTCKEQFAITNSLVHKSKIMKRKQILYVLLGYWVANRSSPASYFNIYLQIPFFLGKTHYIYNDIRIKNSIFIFLMVIMLCLWSMFLNDYDHVPVFELDFQKSSAKI